MRYYFRGCNVEQVCARASMNDRFVGVVNGSTYAPQTNGPLKNNLQAQKNICQTKDNEWKTKNNIPNGYYSLYPDKTVCPKIILSSNCDAYGWKVAGRYSCQMNATKNLRSILGVEANNKYSTDYQIYPNNANNFLSVWKDLSPDSILHRI